MKFDQVRSSPKARRQAAELGIDLSNVADGDRPLRAADVIAMHSATSDTISVTQAADSTDSGPTGLPFTKAGESFVGLTEGTYFVQHSRDRLMTAQRTQESLASAATAWSVTEVDYANVDRSRTDLAGAWKARYGSSLSYLPYVMRAVSLALMDYPHLNAQYLDDGLLVSESVNLGVAANVGTRDRGVCVVRDAQNLSIAETAIAFMRVTGSARSGTISADDHPAPTFCIANNGMYGNVLTMPIINQPNVGILSFDLVTLRPALITLEDGSFGIGVRPKGALALSWDNRAVDGAYAAKFLARVGCVLETTVWDVTIPG